MVGLWMLAVQQAVTLEMPRAVRVALAALHLRLSLLWRVGCGRFWILAHQLLLHATLQSLTPVTVPMPLLR